MPPILRQKITQTTLDFQGLSLFLPSFLNG
nr:MAG TPA: hypothetical protein [Caudoviricetes sp.]